MTKHASTPTADQKPAVLPIRITPQSLMREMKEFNEKLVRGSKRLSALTEEQLAIATAPKEEIWRQDMFGYNLCRLFGSFRL